MYTLLDLRGSIPSFIHVSDGKLHDVNVLDLLPIEAGSIYVVDRGYVDFGRLYGLHRAGAFFVTRAKSNMKAHRLYSAPVDQAVLRDIGQRREDTNLDRGVGLRADRDHSQAAEAGGVALHIATDPFGKYFRKNAVEAYNRA